MNGNKKKAVPISSKNMKIQIEADECLTYIKITWQAIIGLFIAISIGVIQKIIPQEFLWAIVVSLLVGIIITQHFRGKLKELKQKLGS